MSQVSGPVIAVGLVLSAVFVPCAFISGITGQFFRQFALTIAVSTRDFGLQLADAQPGPVGLAAAAKRASVGTTRSLPLAAFPLLGGWLGYAALAPAPGRVASQAAWRPGASSWPRRRGSSSRFRLAVGAARLASSPAR